ncbi:MAG: zinc-binding dehydrogenase [Acidobacteriota bacterium]
MISTTSMTRDVWRIHRAGSLDRLKKRREPLEPPAPGQARVRVEAIGLNFADIFACLGLYSATPPGSFIPGLEFAGVIDEIAPGGGNSASGALHVGDRVFGVTRFGAYVTQINAPVQLLGRVPDGWSSAQAAAFPVQGLTAWYGLVDQARVGDRELVLVHSAAGGVGQCALAILRSLAARVVATVGSEDKRRFLVEDRGLPPESVILRDRRRFGAQLDRALEAANSDGFDVIFDGLSGPYLLPAFSRLRSRGRLVVYGAADFMPGGRRAREPRLLARYFRRPRIDPLALMSQNRSVMGFNLIWLWDQADRLPGAYSALRALSPEPPLVGRRFKFAQAPEAMSFLQSGRNIGKVVLETDGALPSM